MEATVQARPFVSRSDEGEALWFVNNRTTIRARAEDTGGAFGLVESWVPAGYGPPLHVHRREDEAFYVLSGRMRIRCGDEELEAGPGDFALLPRDVPHTFVVDGDEPAHLLTLMTPGGGEEFFALAGRPAEGPGMPPPAAPDIEAMRRAGEETGSEILGPPM